MSLSISTERQSTFLRQLSSEADDLAYFNAIDANRAHLSQFGDETAAKYPTLEAVIEARLHPSNPGKLRFGIWNKDTFVGSINLTPDEYNGAEIGYWLDERHTGNGYATLAARALGKYGRKRYSMVYANVTEGNVASEAVLERAGYQMLAREAGKAVFALHGITRPEASKTKSSPKQAEQITNPQDLERFAELPSRREALRAKDKDNLTIFLSFGVAKKLYRCPCCSGDISIGDSHTILSRVQVSKRYTHHHIDFTCVQDKILPVLTDIKVIDPQEASATAVNARSRKYRNKKRRS
jgi:RimJ/RimL family protein N-acetyltransferase